MASTTKTLVHGDLQPEHRRPTREVYRRQRSQIPSYRTRAYTRASLRSRTCAGPACSLSTRDRDPCTQTYSQASVEHRCHQYAPSDYPIQVW